VTKWELQEFSVDFDIGKLMENFFNLRSFGTYGVIHTHHVQHVTFDPGLLGAGLTSDTAVTWPQAFPANTIPYVYISVNSTAASSPAGMSRCQFGAFNISNTGCTVQTRNEAPAALGAGLYVVVAAFDIDYNTSDY